MIAVSPRVPLVTMEAARRQTSHHLDLVQRQIEVRAERMTITEKAKARSHRRNRSNWTRSDERMFRDHLDRLSFERRGEIDALSRKLVGQERAPALVREKLCENAGSVSA